jgi:flagellar basal-body rod modification protein FlgD
MNALVNFRSNVLGNMTATREERDAAREKITSNLRSRLLALEKAARRGIEKSGAARKTEDTQTASADAAVSSELNNDLDRDAFLQLLVMQMQHQDPLEPMDNTDMVAQLAQFSSLEQMNNLNERFETLAGNIDQLNFISAQGMLGKLVEGINENGQLTSGTVESVHLDGSIVVLTVDGQPLPMSGVIGVAQPAETAKRASAGSSTMLKPAGSAAAYPAIRDARKAYRAAQAGKGYGR